MKLFNELREVALLNIGAITTMTLAELEIYVKISMGLVTIICTILITIHKLRKK